MSNPYHPRRKEISLYDLVRRNGQDNSMKAWVYTAIDQCSTDQSLSNSLKNESAHYNIAFKNFSCTGAVLTRDNSDWGADSCRSYHL
jgi:hypothetical protein